MGCVFQKGMTHSNDSCGEQGRLVLVRKNGNSLGPHPLRVTTGVCQGWHGRDRGGILKGGKPSLTKRKEAVGAESCRRALHVKVSGNVKDTGQGMLFKVLVPS